MIKNGVSVLVGIIVATVMIMSGCGGGDIVRAKSGDTVRVHYTGKYSDGTIFDSSSDGEPLQFTLGEGQLIPGFEQAVIGMQVGEEKTVEIPSDEAYGPHQDELVLVVSRAELPEGLELEVGQQLQLEQEDGRQILVLVTDLSESDVTLDANHPLAGEDLIFDIELVDII